MVVRLATTRRVLDIFREEIMGYGKKVIWITFGEKAELDSGNLSELKTFFKNEVEKDQGEIYVIDLREVAYIFSGSIGILVCFVKKNKENGKKIIFLIEPNSKVDLIFTKLGLGKVFFLFKDVGKVRVELEKV